MKYDRPKAGEWITPIRKGYKLACCDCGLVHKTQFRIVTDQQGRKRIQFRVWLDNRATAAMRRKH